MSASNIEKSKATAEDNSQLEKTGSGGVSTVLLLLVALAAAGLAGWAAWQVLALQDVPARLSGDAGKLQDLSNRLDSLAQESGRQQQRIDDVISSLESDRAAAAGAGARLDKLEDDLAAIPGINAQSRTNWLATEALYYLRIANAQATLAGDAQVAASALQLADDKLRDTGDPSFNKVRAKLSEELAALKALPVIDRTGMSFSLQSLAAQVPDWPFRETAPDNFSPDIELTEPLPVEAGYWDRFVATIKAVFSSIVSVKETDAPRATQLGTAEQTLITEAVRAELQVARLALIGGNAELFRQSLTRVGKQIDDYFNVDTAQVTAARTAVDELLAVELPGPLPDISGSLALLLSMTEAEPAGDGA